MEKNNAVQKNDFYSFYTEDDGENQERTRRVKVFPKQKKSRAPFFVFFVFAIMLAVSAWYGYGFFSSKQKPAEDPISLTVTAPKTISPGSLVEVTVDYKNISSLSIPSAEVFAEYSPDFVVMQTDPETTNTKKNFWNLGSLAPNAQGTIHIRGTLAGNPNEHKTMSVSLQYDHPTYRSSFVIKRSVDVELLETQQSRLRIDGPPSLRPGDTFEYVFHYTDLSDLGALDNISLIAELPSGFTISDEKPTRTNTATNEWSAAALQAAIDPLTKEGNISIKGKTENPPIGNQVVTIELQIHNADGTTTSILKKSSPLQILGGDLALTLATGTATQKPAQFGDTIPLTISYENKGNIVFHGVTITLTQKSSLVDFSTVDTKGGVKEGDHITWSEDSIKALATMEPKAKGDIVLSLPVVPAAVLKDMQFAASDLAVQFAVTADSASQELPNATIVKTPIHVDGPSVKLPLLSDTQCAAFAKDITPENTPSPAKKNVRVYWSVENSLHEINTIQVSALLPEGVAWGTINTRTAGDIAYTENSRTVTWTLNKLPTTVRRIDGSFDVTVADPTLLTDKLLLKNIVLTAQDTVAGGMIKQTLPELTLP